MLTSRRSALAAGLLVILFVASYVFAQTLSVKTPRGNVRSGPGTSYDIVGMVSKGEKYRVEGHAGDWFKVLLETGREGWIYKSLVDVSGGRTITVTPAPASRPHHPFYAKSWAVVIGIDRYQRVPELNYAINDARAVRDRLKRLGFDEIIFIQNETATRDCIMSLLGTELPQRVNKEDRVFIFFAGHGQTQTLASGRKRGYILPVDADNANLAATVISMDQVQFFSDSLPAKHVLYVIDACYSGLVLRRAGGLSPLTKDYLKKVTSFPTRQIITAGGEGEQVIEQGGHGLFTKMLLSALDGHADNNGDGTITFTELGSFLKPRVSQASRNAHTPRFGNLEGEGEFVFLTPRFQAERRVTAALDPALRQMREELERQRRELAEEKPRLERDRLAMEKAGIESERKKLQAERAAPGGPSAAAGEKGA